MRIRPNPYRPKRPIFPLMVASASAPPDPQPPACRPTELRAFRWSDMEYVMEIERQGFPSPLSEMRLRQVLDTQGTVCTVAERLGSVVGFAVHSYHEVTIRLLAVAVAPTSRRTGVGSALVGRVKRSLAAGRWMAVETVAAEDALAALLFLKAQGFRAAPDARGRYTGDHGHVRMRYAVEAGVAAEVAAMDTGCGEASNFAVE